MDDLQRQGVMTAVGARSSRPLALDAKDALGVQMLA
jgi:hypothetical protein